MRHKRHNRTGNDFARNRRERAVGYSRGSKRGGTERLGREAGRGAIWPRLARKDRSLAGDREGILDAEESAGICVQADDGSATGSRDQDGSVFGDNGSTRVGGIWPIGHPLEAEGAVEAVKIGNTRKQSKRVLAYVDAQRPVAKFNDCGGEGSVPGGLRAAPGELAEMTFDDSEGWREGVHGKVRVAATSRFRDTIFGMSR
jgi:hypothetical protein